MVAKAVTALLALSMVAGQSLAASAADRCPDEREMSAFETRQVQIEFMVAALSCQGIVSDKYNTFMRKFGPSLNVQSQVFQGYFRRSYGKSSTHEVDSYLTSIANDVSERALQTHGFCTQENAQLDAVLAPTYTELTPATLHAVDMMTPVHAGCRPRPAIKTVVASAAPVPPTPAAPAPAVTPAPAAPATAAAASAATPPAAAPVVTAAATPPAAAPVKPAFVPRQIVVGPDGTPRDVSAPAARK